MRTAVMALITIYRKCISPFLPPACRFRPTCSEYAQEALRVHGLGRGSLLTLRRMARCRPWGGTGWDPVPEKSPTASCAPHTETVKRATLNG